ncbi:hypothetical protein [Novosphingobium fuchskuhlense]|uniref:hypothetical protein n=1 Tax=Novosphingobium fuchskuhlense TaxID=1117702 RepID=UPI000A58ED4F|nr:hypothetical protein [Novosphingobium fuchskuhlense]
MSRKALLASCLAATAFVSGCSPQKPAHKPAFSGLLAGDGITFTSSPDGSTLSLLYDQFEIKTGAVVEKGTINKDRVAQRGFTLGVIGPNGSGSAKAQEAIQLFVRGFHHAPAGSWSLKVEAPGGPIDITPKGSDEPFTACLALAADKAAIPVRVTMTLKAPVPSDTQVTVDSIDIARTGGDLKGPPGSCPPEARQTAK